MEVEVNGSPVAFGDIISATGEMIIKSSRPYVLRVDDVVWSPISSSNGVDTYLISTNGAFRVFVDDTLVFYFSNSVTTDFELYSTGSRQYNGDVTIRTNYGVNGYNQDVLLTATNKIYLVLNAINITLEGFQALALTCNNGSIQNTSYSQGTLPSGLEYVTVVMTVDGVDSSTYCAIFCGNVLAGFFTPES